MLVLSQAAAPMKKAKIAGLVVALLAVGGGAAFFLTRPKVPPTPVTEGGPRPPGAVAQTTGKMRVMCTEPGKPISPRIYGIAFADAPKELGATQHRWGGNTTSRYNVELGGAWNTASDWFFQNVKVDSTETFLDKAEKSGGTAAVTVPILGWVAKDTTSYSFPVAEYGNQNKVDPEDEKKDKGDGMTTSGVELTADPARANVKSTPEQVKAWVSKLREADKKAGKRRIQQWILDNEPALWNSTHRDVHPWPVTYDELMEKTLAYSKAVREADPEGEIAGPAAWGWPEYFYSAKDAKEGFFWSPDRKAHGGEPLLAWYLRKLRAEGEKDKKRYLDVLDIHFYPQGENIQNKDMTGGEDVYTVQRRFRATRALWDKSYVDESYIKDRIYLIPRMKELIEENYPGTKLQIGEWNFGAEQHVSGALAVAEAFGRFAEFGVDSAFYWQAPKKESPAFQGFLAYRNYDGKGAHFLDELVKTEAPFGSSLFVSRDPKTKNLVAIFLNFESDKELDATVDWAGCGAQLKRKFVYSATSKAFVEEKGGALDHVKLPPYSITVMELGS